MARLDDRLREDLERAARPADPSGLYEDLIRRRERLLVRRRVQAGALALVVLVGTVAGVAGLSRVFREGEPAPVLTPVAPRPMENGLLAYTTGDAITIQEVDGSDARTIPPPAPGLAWHIAWAPDGRRLAVAVFGDPARSLWVIRDDGQDPVRIAEADNVSRPSWHPDGEHLTFSLTNDATTEVHVTRSDGTHDRVVYSEAAPGTYAVFSATFSPDGSQILFDAGTDSGYDIFVMDADGSNVRRITRTGTDYNPSWSPDGSRILFTRQEDASESDIFVMRSDGSAVRRLTDDGPRFTNLEPRFSPDGRLITYGAGENGGVGPTIVMNADGSEPRTLIDAEVLGFSWQPIPVEPVATEPTGTPPPEPTEGEEVGLGLRLCDVTSAAGTYVGVDPDSQALVGVIPDAAGSCDRSRQEVQGVVAIDLSGYGLAEIASDPFPCQGWCRAFAAPDVDGDGTDELLVQNIEFSVVGLLLFDVVPNEHEPGLVAVTVEPPGDTELEFQGFDGTGLPQFWIGGDGFGVDALRCEPSGEGRVLISTTAQMVPPDSPDAVWEAHETRFVLENGVLHVVGARDFAEPAGSEPSFTETGGCGADLDPR